MELMSEPTEPFVLKFTVNGKSLRLKTGLTHTPEEETLEWLKKNVLEYDYKGPGFYYTKDQSVTWVPKVEDVRVNPKYWDEDGNVLIITPEYNEQLHKGKRHNGKEIKNGGGVICLHGSMISYKHGVLHDNDDSCTGRIPAIYAYGNSYSYQNGVLQSDGDKPAINEYGNLYWYDAGNLHRGNDLPAVKLYDGTLEWRHEGVLHRVGNPARILPDGTEEHYLNGVLVQPVA